MIDNLPEELNQPLNQPENTVSETVLSNPQETPANEPPIEAAAEEKIQSNPKTLIVPVIAIREGIMFPQTEAVLNFGRKKSVKAVEMAEKHQTKVVLVAQKNKSVDEPEFSDLYSIGTLGSIERTLSTANQINALVQGVKRVRLLSLTEDGDIMKAEVEILEDEIDDQAEVDILSKHLSKSFNQAVNMGKPVEFLNFMKLMNGVNAGELADQVASTLNLNTRKKQRILETLDVKKRLELVLAELTKELKEYEIERDIVSKTQKTFDKNMRENVLRERLRTIKKELGEIDEEEEEIDDLEQQLAKLKLPKEVKKKVDRELKRLERMSFNNPEGGYIRTWLETIIELPWDKRSRGSLSLKKAAKILDQNHHGLKEVKDRILEYLAVMKLKANNVKIQDRQVPTILCFVGAPGVGKTSIGKSIAEALGREFVKISLGGIRDEAEIRGHRRTYVGAMAGRIITGLQTAGKKNPVFMLDEIDKIGADYRGDPSAALLEALDPEQNREFSDHYLEVPFDLSEVLFITTANTLSTIPSALRDRLEIIEYSGYTEEEKFHIIKDHLFQKVLEKNGLNPNQVIIPDETIIEIIRHYTREAGVREVERQVGKMIRKVARQIADEKYQKTTIKPKDLIEYLGPERYDHTLTEETDEVGLATGLAWTSVGGDVLFIEVALTPGKGRIQLTGKLGDVMKESAQAALTYVKSQAKNLGISAERLEKTDVHIHIPEGAVPKDGPSAGITMTTAIVSAFTDTPVKREVAMTGEVTLRGRVLEIGGFKEKVIAAHRAGSQFIIAPKKNEKDLREIPDSAKKHLQFYFVDRVEDVLAKALKKASKKKTA